MKSLIIKLMCVVLLFGIATSCGKNNKNDIEQLKEDYMEACLQRDFDKARALAEKADMIEKSENKDDEFSFDLFNDSHVKYVNEKEIYYLLASNSTDNANRIIFMFNSIDSEDLPDMSDVLEVATSQNNEYLAIRLYQGGVDVNDNVLKGALTNNMEELLELIIKNDKDALSNQSLMDYAEANPKLSGYVESYKKENSERESQQWENEVRDAISGTISPRPALGMVKSDYYGKIPKEYTDYNDQAKAFNERCRETLVKAIDKKDWVAANRIANAMKPTLEWNNMGDWCKVVEHEYDHSSVYNAFKVVESNEAKQEALQMIRNAQK